MKHKLFLLTAVISSLNFLTGHAAMIMDADDFEHDTIGEPPTKPTLVSPTAPTANAFVKVVDEIMNIASTGKGISLLDYDTSAGLQLEYDFTIILDNAPATDLDRAARLSAVRVDLSFAPQSYNDTSTKSHYLNITLGEHLTSQSDSSRHFLDCRLWDNGMIDFVSSDGFENIDNDVRNPDNTLSIFANDHEVLINYIGPNDSTYNLPANSVAYWLNGSLITFSGQEYALMENPSTSNGTVFTSTNNLGRFAIVSTVANSDSLEYVFDNIMISDLDSVQDPTGTSWLVSDSLTGLVYTGYANQGQTDPVNMVPDYSSAGYRGGGVAIPFVPVIPAASVVLSDDGAGDDTTRIQDAINAVSTMQLRTLENGALVIKGTEQEGDENVFRGVVLFEPGDYEVANTLNISASGVVIRGAGSQEDSGTRITFTSTSDQNPDLFFVGNGAGAPAIDGTPTDITDAYVPVGAKSFTVADATGYAVGDTIIIQMMVNQQWIDDLDMAQWGWTTGYYQEIKYRRTVKAVNGNKITIDAPVLQTIEDQYGGARIYKYSYAGLNNIGFEGLRLESYYASETDENHGWDGIQIENLENGWVRQVTARYFAFGLVNIRNYSRWITVEDCANLDPKGTTAGGRRYSFTVDESDSILWQRCLTRGGRHDFASGSRVQGPNVFVDCRATETINDIGPHHRYSTGQLYDNIFGGEMNVQNRAGSGSGHGWSGAQIMFWNCDASSIICDAPTGAMNWVVGSSAYQAESNRTPEEPFGIWDSLNQAVSPRSLYYAQLADRLGANALNNVLLPEQKEGNVWAELLLWDGDGLFLGDVIAWANEENFAKSGVPVAIDGRVRNLQMLGRGNFTYSWSHVSGPVSTTFADSAALQTTATFSQPGTYVLNLSVDDGTDQASADVTVEVFDPANVPLKPANLIATGGHNTISLDWDDNGEPDLLSYSVYRKETSDSSYSLIASNVGLSHYVDDTAVNGITYDYAVTAIDLENTSPYSEISATPVADIIPPANPIGLIATADDSTVSLNWDDNGEPDLFSYRVYRSENQGSYGTTPQATILTSSSIDPSNYVDITVTNDITYYYVVTAVDDKGNESGYSAEISVTPKAPTVLVDILFGTNNDGLGGFTRSALNPDDPINYPNQISWSTEVDSERYINKDPDEAENSGVDGGTKNSSLLQSFILDRSVGKRYIIEGTINLIDGYADDNNRLGFYLFGNDDNLTDANGPEENESGALCLINNFDNGTVSLYEGINLSPIAGASASTGRALDNTIFDNKTVKFIVSISFVESGGTEQIEVTGVFEDDLGATTEVTAIVPAASYTGDYFGFVTRARNRGVTGRNAPFTVDYKSFKISGNVAPTNLPPAFTIDPIVELDATEDVDYSGIGSLADDASDAEGDPMTFSLVSGPVWLSVDSLTGALSGTPTNDDVGLNSFTVEVNALGGSDQATLEITVNNVNDAPVAQPDSFVTAEGAELNGNLFADNGSGADFDIDGDAFTVFSNSNPTKGIVAVNNDGTFTYTPNIGSTGTDTFTYTITDGAVESSPATVSVTINAVPLAADDDGYNVSEGGTLTVPAVGVLSNDSDADGDPLTAVLDTGVSNGTLTLNSDGSFEYTHDGSETTGDSFTYVANDGKVDSAIATVTIEISPVNDPPAFSSDSFTKTSARVDLAYSETLAGDAVDPEGDAMTFSLVSGPAWLILDPNTGALSGTPSAGDLGLNIFTVQVTAAGGSDTAELQIHVYSETEFTNADATNSWISNPLNWSYGLPTGGLAGTIAIDAGYDSEISYDGYNVVHTNGTLSRANHFSGLKLSAGTVWEMDGANAKISSTRGINVTDATFILHQGTAELFDNNADSIINAGGAIVINSGTMDIGRYFYLNGGDLTVNGGSLTGITDMGSRNFHGGGTANLNGGTISATYLTFGGTSPFNVNFDGTTAGSLTIENFGGNRANTNNIDINFDPGTLMSMQLTNPVESGVSGDGQLGWSVVGSETGLPWAEALWADGRLTYNGQDYTMLGDWATVTTTGFGDGSKFAYDSGTNTLSIAVAVANNAPVANPDDATTDEDTPVIINVLANDSDADGDTLSISTFTQGGNGSVIDNPDGTFTYTPAADFNGEDSFTYFANDGIADSATAATVTITIDPVNDAPTWDSDPVNEVNATEDAIYSATLADDASDIDAGASLTFSKVSGPAWLNVATDGTLSGTPANNDAGDNSFTVSVSDGIDPAVEATLNITVDNVNDAPVFTSDPFSTANATEDAVYSATIAGSATDEDGDTLTYSKVSGPAWLSIAANGDLSGTPANADVALNTWTVSVSDGTAPAVEATLTVTVINTNDAPVFTLDPFSTANATEDNVYSATIAGSASDVDVGDSLTYSKVSGTAWLSVAGDGTLSGTPTNGDVGSNVFTVQVVDGNGGTDNATLNITVDPAAVPTMYVQSIVPQTINVGKGNKIASVLVTIYDDQGNPLSGATVTVDLTGDYNEMTLTGTTNASGDVTLNSTGTAKGGISYTATIVNVTHPSYEYDSINSVTSASY